MTYLGAYPVIPDPPAGLSQTQIGVYFANQAIQNLRAVMAANPQNAYTAYASPVQHDGEAQLTAYWPRSVFPATDLPMARVAFTAEWYRLLQAISNPVGAVWVPNPYFLWLGRTVLENQANILFDGVDPSNPSIRVFQTTAGTWRWDPTQNPTAPPTPATPTVTREWVQVFVDALGPKAYDANGITLYQSLAWRVVSQWSNGDLTYGAVSPWSAGWISNSSTAPTAGVGSVVLFRLDWPWFPDPATFTAVRNVLGGASVPPPAIVPSTPVTPPTGGTEPPLIPLPPPGTPPPNTNTGGGGGPVVLPPIPDPGTTSPFSATTLAVIGIAATVLLAKRGRR